MAKMKVTVLTGPQGSGKSTVMRKDAIAQPGLYLFAFQFNFLSAVRRGAGSGEVCFDSIRGLWRPTRSIAQYVNSNSREAGQTVEAFLRKRWNGASNGPSPTAFFGVYDDNRLDAQGFKIYRLAEDVRQLMAEASTAHLLAEAV